MERGKKGKRGKRVGEINNPLLAAMAAMAAMAAWPKTQRKTMTRTNTLTFILKEAERAKEAKGLEK